MGVKKAEDLLDDDFRQSYFKQLLGQYKTKSGGANDPQARTEGDRIASIAPEAIQWEDIYQLETLIVRLESEADVRRHAWNLRAEYAKVAPADYAKYEKSNPPDPDKGPIELVRADSVRIQEELNWYYTVLWVQETFRSNLLKRVGKKTGLYLLGYLGIGVVLIVLGFLGGLLDLFGRGGDEDHAGKGTNIVYAATNHGESKTSFVAVASFSNAPAANTNTAGKEPGKTSKSVEDPLTRATNTIKDALPVFGTYLLVVVAGTLGAMISVLRRIQGMALDGNSDTNLVQLEQNSSSIDLSPLLGAAFALILLFMFMGSLLSGALFPELPKDHSNIFLGCVPSECPQLAKLIVWSFIAGFAEKFVPDALDRLQTRSTTTDKTTAPKQT